MSKILLVDDEEMLLELSSEYLRLHGLDAITSADAQEAMEIIGREQDLAMVFLDIGLGTANGLDVLSQIRALRPTLPVVMLTGRGYDDELMAEASKRGATWYLSKGLPMEVMLREIKRLLPKTQPQIR